MTEEQLRIGNLLKSQISNTDSIISKLSDIVQFGNFKLDLFLLKDDESGIGQKINIDLHETPTCSHVELYQLIARHNYELLEFFIKQSELLETEFKNI